jgi:hypothetical protein
MNVSVAVRKNTISELADLVVNNNIRGNGSWAYGDSSSHWDGDFVITTVEEEFIEIEIRRKRDGKVWKIFIHRERITALYIDDEPVVVDLNKRLLDH